MSTSVDNRIVEMKFDNANFEKNIKASQETLEKFSKALNLTSSAEAFNKSLNSAIDGVSFDSMAASLEFLSDRFSAMGIVGMTILQNLTTSAMNAAKSIFDFTTNAVIQGGLRRAQNIENAKFQLEGFDILWKDIAADIEYGVKDTAYGLDAAAMAASQLVASGVQFGDTFGTEGSSPMAKALRGISGLAAMTNRDYTEIARIFTTVAGNGRLMGQQLNEIGERGVNAAAQIADVFNGVNGFGEKSAEYLAGVSEETQNSIRQLTSGLKITEEQVRDFASKGKIDFAMFSEAMDAAFGAHAKDANETFQGIMSNIRAALAKIGADFWTPVIQNRGMLVEMLKSLRLRINDIRTAIHDVLGWTKDDDGIEYLKTWQDLLDKVFTSVKRWLDEIDIKNLSLGVADIIHSIMNFGQAIINIFKAIGSLLNPVIFAFKQVFNVEGTLTFLDSITKLSSRFKDFTENLRPTSQLLNNIHSISKMFFSVLELGWEVLKEVANSVKEIVGSLIPASSGVVDIAGNVSKLVTKLTDFIRKSEIISTFFKTITGVVTSAIGAVTEFIGSIIGGFFEATTGVDGLSKGFDKLSDFVGNVNSKIKTFIETHLPSLKEGGRTLGSILSAPFQLLSGIFNMLGKIGSNIGPIFSGAIKGAIDLFDRLLGIILNVFNTLNFDNVFKVVNGGFFAGILLAFQKFVTQFSGFSTQFGAVFAKINAELNKFLGTNGAKASLLKNYAIAIGILAASLAVIASIDTDKLTAAFAALSGLMVELSVVTEGLFSLGKISTNLRESVINAIDASANSKMYNNMIKFSAAIFILAGALKMLATLDTDQLAIGLTGITAIIMELVIVSKIMADNKVSMVEGSTNFLLFATGVTILAKALKSLAELSWEELARGVVGLSAIIANLIGISITLSKTKSDLVKGSVGLIAFAAGVLIISEAVEQMADLSWENLAKGLLGLQTVLGTITGMAITLNKTGSSLKQMGLSLVPFAAGVVILAEALNKMGHLSWNELVKGLVGLTVVLADIAGMAIVLKVTESSITQLGLVMIPLAAGIEILAVALTKMGGMSWNEIAKGLTSLVVSLGAIAGMAIALNATGTSLAGVAAGMLVFAAALAILVPEMKALGSMSWMNIVKALTALAGAFTVIGVAALVLKPLVGTIAVLGASIAVMGVGCAAAGAGVALFAAGIASLGTSLGVAGNGIASMIKAVIGLLPEIVRTFGDVISAFADVIANAIPSIVKAFVAIITSICDAILEAAPKIFSTILQLMDQLIDFVPSMIDKVITMIVKIFDGLAARMDDLVQAAAKLVKSFIDAVVGLFKDVTLSELVNAIKDLSAAALLLAIIGEMGTAAIKGLGILVLIIAGLGAVVVGLGALVSKIPELEELLSRGIPVLEKIGYAIGSFLGNIVGGLMAGISNALPTIADNLSDFMTRLQPFIDGVKKVDESVAKSSLYLAETILVLTGTSLLNSIASFFGASTGFGELGEQLVPFGESMKKYSNAVEGINPDVVEASANAGKAIAEMASALPNEGGLLAKIVGENSMGIIGPQLSEFGKSIKAYSDAVDGINPENVEASANAGKAIAEMAKELPNEGGFLGKIVGENSMGIIGPQLEQFGASLKAYSDAVNGINPEVVEASAIAGKAIAEMASTLPNSGGLVSWFTGENDIDAFGEKLVPFGEKLKDYGDAVSGINAIAITASAIAGKALAELAATLPNTGGVVSWFTGNNDIDDFGSKLETFGRNLKKYSDVITEDGGINALAVWASAIAGQALVELAATVPNTGGLFSFFSGNNDLDTFGSKLEQFGRDLAAYSNVITESNMDIDAVTKSAVAGQILAELAETVPKTGGLFSFFTGDNDFGKFGQQLEIFGTSLVNFSTTVADVNHEAVAATLKTIDDIVTMFHNILGIDASAGMNFRAGLMAIAESGMDGFIQGFKNAKAEVKQASADTKQATLDGFGNIDHDIYEKGKKASESFINGFRKNKSDARAEASELSESVIRGFSTLEIDIKQKATAAITKFVTEFTNSQQKGYDAGHNLASKALDGIASVGFFKAGADAMQGYINGMNSLYWNVYWAAYNIGSVALTAAKTAVNSSSPSKEFMKLGMYNDQGLAQGMMDNSDLVEKAAEETSKSALNVVANVLAYMSSMLDDELEISPTITPIFDSSQIQNGISTINGMTGSMHLGTSYSLANGIGYYSGMSGNQVYNDSNVISAINSLESRLDTVATRMENLQIVLDTGTLVGETAPNMNMEFGNIDTLVQRGVM